MRAAVLHGPDDLRVEDTAEPEGEVARPRRGRDRVRDRREDAAPRAPDPRRLPEPLRPRDGRRPGRHRRARLRRRLRRVRRMRPVPGRPAAALPRDDVGARRLRGADRRAGGARCTRSPTASTSRAPRWPSRSPPASTRSARADGADAADAAVLGGGTMGLMIARLLVLAGRDVTALRPPSRAPRAGRGARRAGDGGAAGRPRPRLRGRRAPGGVAGGRRERGARRDRRARRRLPGRDRGRASRPGRCTTTSSTSAARSTTAAPRSTARSTLLATGAVDWRALAGETIGLDDLAAALRRPASGEARKLVVDPAR